MNKIMFKSQCKLSFKMKLKLLFSKKIINEIQISINDDSTVVGFTRKTEPFFENETIEIYPIETGITQIPIRS